MPNYRIIKTALAGALLAGGSLLVVPEIASATVVPHGFSADQAKLEQQLQDRSSQFVRLTADVTAAAKTTLSPSHAATLNANITAANTNIQALIVKVPKDTTEAQLRADRASMLKQNRVFAVLTPQVFQTIEADAIAAEVTALQGDEPGLQSAVNALNGEPGYMNALNHYTAFIKLVNEASLDSNNVATTVLAQTPADYPGDTNVFVHANKELLNADIDLAHANYDAAVIGLASGGYGGA